jgi:hypothetical protein
VDKTHPNIRAEVNIVDAELEKLNLPIEFYISFMHTYYEISNLKQAIYNYVRPGLDTLLDLMSENR